MRNSTTTSLTGSGRSTTPVAASSDAIERVRPLLRAAATTDLADHEGWQRLRHTAHVTLVVLAQGNRLPDHLVVTTHDPPVVVQRTLAAAWQHLTSAPTRASGDRRRTLLGVLAG